jgi:hypothetical protein
MIGRLGRVAGMAAFLFATQPGAAVAQGAAAAPAAREDKQLLSLADGESRDIFGTTYTAHGEVLAVVVPSSELVSVAVLDGILAGGGRSAAAGRVLVTPIEHGGTQLFQFDARRLAASLNPAWLMRARPPLDRIAASQRRQIFWGRLEPVGANAAAPSRPAVEAMRQTYLTNAAITALRREAAGDRDVLARLTAARFAAAIAAGDAATVAALIDPQPFVATGADAPSWQADRAAFARRLTDDPALRQALADAALQPAAAGSTMFVAAAPGRPGFRINLVARDRALFVTSLEPAA